MKSYRGYYIDHIIFNSEAEIDQMIKEQNIRAYKSLCIRFDRDSSMENCKAMSEKGLWLLKHCGVTCEELEEIELAAYDEVA